MPFVGILQFICLLYLCYNGLFIEAEDEDEWIKGYKPLDGSFLNAVNDQILGAKHRVKRQQAEAYNFNGEKTRCPLLLVADYRFFKEMGGSNYKTTVNYLVCVTPASVSYHSSYLSIQYTSYSIYTPHTPHLLSITDILHVSAPYSAMGTATPSYNLLFTFIPHHSKTKHLHSSQHLSYIIDPRLHLCLYSSSHSNLRSFIFKTFHILK